MSNDTTRLFGLGGVQVVGVDLDGDDMPILALVTCDEQARCCPGCGVRSESPHSWRVTRPRDLPVAGRRTELRWNKRRWRCRNPDCGRRTFTEALPTIPPRHRLTARLRAPKWVPTEDQVLKLTDVVPDRYRAALWLGAGQGLRLGEVLGLESGTRCAEFLHRELHVVQQLRHSPEHFDGFYLAPPKSGSSGTVDLDPFIAEQLTEHIRAFPPTEFRAA